MKTSIFTMPRRGFLGQNPVGADYMQGVEARALMLAKACRIRRDDGAEKKEECKAQLLLPLK